MLNREKPQKKPVHREKIFLSFVILEKTVNTNLLKFNNIKNYSSLSVWLLASQWIAVQKLIFESC